MKCTVLILVFGLASVLAVPATEEITSTKKPCPHAKEKSQSNDIHKEELVTNKESTTQANAEEIEIAQVSEVPSPTVEDSSSFDDGEVNIAINDSASPLEDVPEPQTNFNDFSVTNYLYRNALQRNIEEELVAAAKGFVPVPLIYKKRKQTPRRRYTIRRYYNPYRNRRFHFYPYYAYYRPSSLRFY